MVTVRCGTFELATALIICAPCLMIPPLLVVLADHVAGGVLQEDQRGCASGWRSWMNWPAFCASGLNSTPRTLARIPTGNPWIRAQPVIRLGPYSGLNSSKSEPSTIRATTSRGSNGVRRSSGASPSRVLLVVARRRRRDVRRSAFFAPSPAARRSGGRSGWRPARRRRSSRPARTCGRASRRRPVTRRRTPPPCQLDQRRAAQGTPSNACRPSPRGSDVPGMYAPPAVALPKTSATVGITGGGHPGEVTEHRAAGDEDVLRGVQVGAAGLDQPDHRQPVSAADVHCPAAACAGVHGLLAPPRTVGSVAISMHSTPATTPIPVTTLAPTGNSVPRPPAARAPGSTSSRPPAARCASRGSSFPREWCRAAYFSPAPATARACSVVELLEAGQQRGAVGV